MENFNVICLYQKNSPQKRLKNVPVGLWLIFRLKNDLRLSFFPKSETGNKYIVIQDIHCTIRRSKYFFG